jgi:small subunit ribosomal protein S1
MPEASEAEEPKGSVPQPSSEADHPVEQASASEARSDDRPSAQAEGASVDAGAEGDDTDASSEGEAGAEAASEGEAGAEASSEGGAEGDAAGAGKRKRRRRKRRKGEATAAGDQEAPAGEGGEQRARRRDASAAPFLRFFLGAHANRKHGFAVGEEVAGRVKSVADGTITVDLFGKALAYADEFEPREIPPLPEPVRDAEASAGEAGAGEAGVNEAAVGEASVSEASAPHEATTSIGEVEAPSASEAQASEVRASDSAVESASGEEPSPAEADAMASEAGADIDGDAAADLDDAEHTLSGDASPAHGPLPPAPIVPESFPRPEPPPVGAVFRGRVGAVAESGHIALVNRNIDRPSTLANLERYRSERRRVQGLVFGFNRGGFDVLVEGVRAFCPASAMTLEELDDPAQILGQKLEFLLPAGQSVTKDIVVSRRSILERLQRKKAREFLRALEPGKRFKGRVTQVREFGLFVDIGAGVDGLVHQSELSYAHGVKPSDVAQVGDEVEVQVLRVGAEPQRADRGARRDRLARVSLSMKALLPDPWDAHADVLSEGSARMAKVTRTTDFGAFMELVPQIEGLLHITELGRDLRHANQAVKEGDELPVVVERVDKGARRITLSKLSQQEYDEYQAAVAAGTATGEDAPRSVRPGSRIKVKVVRAEGRGLVVRVAGVLGKRARGYIPGSELGGGDRSGDLRKSYPQGSEIEVKVVGIDRDGGLRCSPKALVVDDERRAIKDYRRDAAKQGFGTFGDLLRAKLGQADSK